MKNVLVLISAFAASFAYSQAPFAWSQQLGSGGNEEAHAITSDATGNIYSVGTYSNMADMDPGPGVFTLTPGGNEDVYISKLDQGGIFIWAKKISGPDNESVHSIACDLQGNILITGSFENFTMFDAGPPTFTLNSAGDQDIYITKLDANGNFLWAKRIGGSGPDAGYGITSDASGNVYATGSFSGTVDFDPGPGVFTLSATNQAIFVVKLNTSGNFVFAKQLGGDSPLDIGKSIAVDDSANIYTTGYFMGSSDFNPGPLTATLTSSGGGDVFVSKLYASGNFAWARSVGGSMPNDIGECIKVDKYGGVYIAGIFEGTADFDPGLPTFTLNAIAQEDAFVCKLGSNGAFQFAKQIGGDGSDLIKSLCLDHLGNIYAAGNFSGDADFDPGPATSTLSSVNGGNDIFISKLNNAGNFLWVEQIGGVGPDQCNGIDVDINQNIHATGSFIMNVDFNAGVGTYTMDAPGNFDAYVLKLFQCAAMGSTIVAQNNVSCNGLSDGSATVSAFGGWGITYTWTPLNTYNDYANNLMPFNYTVTASNNCGNFVTQTVNITQPAPIYIQVVINPTVLCVGHSATLTSSASGGVGPYTYSWTPAGTGQTLIVSPTITTQYFANVTDATNCTGFFFFTVPVDPCAGLQEYQQATARVSPNPSKDQINIHHSYWKENTMLYLCDVSGKTILKQKSAAEDEMVNISELERGIYFLRIESLSGSSVIKFIKE